MKKLKDFDKKAFFGQKVPKFTLMVKDTLDQVEGTFIEFTCFRTYICQNLKEKINFGQPWPSYASWRNLCTAGGASLIRGSFAHRNQPRFSNEALISKK